MIKTVRDLIQALQFQDKDAPVVLVASTMEDTVRGGISEVRAEGLGVVITANDARFTTQDCRPVSED